MPECNKTVTKRTHRMKKDAQLMIKLDKDLKKDFNKLCKELDTSASREIRHFMRDFVEKHTKKK